MNSLLVGAFSILLVGPQASTGLRLIDEAVAKQIEALKSPDEKTRARAALALTQMKEKARAAVPALLEALADPAPGGQVRMEALRALMFIAPEDRAVIYAAIEVLTDMQQPLSVRNFAVRLFSYSGPQAKGAVPTLIWALSDEEPRIREGAALSLGKIGPAAKMAIPALTSVMKDDKSEGVREQAERALKAIKDK